MIDEFDLFLTNVTIDLLRLVPGADSCDADAFNGDPSAVWFVVLHCGSFRILLFAKLCLCYYSDIVCVDVYSLNRCESAARWSLKSLNVGLNVPKNS